MKNFRYIGITAIMLFSFFYTDKIANLTLEKNKLYQNILENKEEYNVSSVSATIHDEYITPGLNGKDVNVKGSYYNMKNLDIFNSYYLIYDEITPEVSLENNKDKIINRGNSSKNSVAFILEYNEDMINFFKENGYDASILVDINTFKKSESLEQINNEVNNFNNLESLLNKYSSNPNICYLNKNEDVCRKSKKYLVKTDKILNKGTLYDIKNSITSGDIYYVEKNMDKKSMQILINSIMYKDLDIVRLSKLISEERD